MVTFLNLCALICALVSGMIIGLCQEEGKWRLLDISRPLRISVKILALCMAVAAVVLGFFAGVKIPGIGGTCITLCANVIGCCCIMFIGKAFVYPRKYCKELMCFFPLYRRKGKQSIFLIKGYPFIKWITCAIVLLMVIVEFRDAILSSSSVISAGVILGVCLLWTYMVYWALCAVYAVLFYTLRFSFMALKEIFILVCVRAPKQLWQWITK